MSGVQYVSGLQTYRPHPLSYIQNPVDIHAALITRQTQKKKKLNLDGMARFSHGVNKERSVEKLESVPVQYELLGWLHPPSP